MNTIPEQQAQPVAWRHRVHRMSGRPYWSYTERRIFEGEQAEPLYLAPAPPPPLADIELLLRDVLTAPGINSITAPDYAVRVAKWLESQSHTETK